MLTVERITTAVLEPTSFRLADGECLAVRGPSGSGKSLLLRAIADLDPNEGEVTLDGTPRSGLSGPAWRSRVGYLPAEPGWWSERLPPHFEDWPAALRLAGTLGLDEAVGERPLSQLSTGERQRLALVRALLVGPRVLLLDEPTAALDDEATHSVEAMLRERRDQGLGLVWVTHDAAQAARIADRSLVIENGRLRETAA